MPRIVLVGAGSVEFTRNLLGDILTSPALRDSEIALHDIDAERLATAERMARWTADALGADADDHAPTSTGARRSPARTSSSTRSRSAARGRRRSTSTCRPGSGCATRSPTRSASAACSAALRTIPVVLGIARDMEEICPDAWLLNYTNPLAILVRAVSEASDDPGRRAVPLGLLDDRPAGRATSACSATRSTPTSAGPQPPRVRPPPRAPRPRPLPGPARVRRGRPGARRRPRPGRAVPAARLLPDRIVRAPRRVQPVVHRQARRRRRRGRAVPHPDRRVPRPGRRTTSTSTPRRSACSTPASRSRSSGAASTRRRSPRR